MKTRKNKRLTGNPVRELPFLAWKNVSAPIETMRGSIWKRALARERTFWNALVKRAHIKDLSATFQKELTMVSACGRFQFLTLGCGAIEIQHSNGSGLHWKWKWSKRIHNASDIDFYDNHVYFITEDEKDKYVSNLTCQSADGRNVWTKHAISGQMAIKDGLCYFVNVIYPFNTVELMCCDAATGKNEHCILKEPDDERFIGIIQEAGRALYCKTSTWNSSRVWRIEGKKHTEIQKGTQRQWPLGEVDGHECGFYMKNGTNKWIPFGQPLTSWNLPPGEPQWINVQSGHVLTVDEGRKTLYLCAPHKKPIKIHSIIAGDFEPSPLTKWHPTGFQSFVLFTPEQLPYSLFVPNGMAIAKTMHPNINKHNKAMFKEIDDLQSSLNHTNSADGTKVPYLLVKSKKTHKVKGLLCYVYSAYGSGTNVGWPHQTWSPLLRRGVAIAYCFARGGGDKGMAWMNAGQDIEHDKTVEDFEATIRDAQKVTGIDPKRTIIYGRSAGGMMVGATTMRNPDGSLHGAMYTEVPFTDILRTQTNPTINLTPSGMSEYGNPATSPVAFEAMLRLSPINSMPVDGAPGVFVLCRTGLRDQQVLPFEPVKFIQKLRGDVRKDEPAGKFLDYEKDETHVYSSKMFLKERAVDLALLHRFLENKI